MNYKRIGFGLGLFSIALGAAELFGGRRIARTLSAEGWDGLVRAFGARELAAGAGLLVQPAHSAMVWSRVVGDAMDLAALGVALGRAPRNKVTWGALGFVAAAAAIDVAVARGLDRTTGVTLPHRGREPAAA